MRTRPASPLPIIVPAIYPVGHLPKCRSLLTISDGSSCRRTEMPMRRLWSDPERAQFHIQRAADWANNRGGNGPFGLGVMLMRRREFLSGFSAAWPLAAQANKPYRIGYLSLCAAQTSAVFPTIRLPNSNCLSTSRPRRHSGSPCRRRCSPALTR